MRQSRIIALSALGLLLALGGCANASIGDLDWGDFSWSELAWTDDQIRMRDWTSLPPSCPQTANCYRTLGEIDCFKAPVPGAGHRRVALQDDDSTDPR